MWSKLFGGSTVKVTAQDRSILDLKLQRDKLKQYQKRIEKVLDREQEIAKEALAQGNKKRALTALRQRKYQETLLTQTDSQLETLQKLVRSSLLLLLPALRMSGEAVSSIEFSLVEKDVLFGLKQGSAVLKELHKEMNLEMVEQLMSDSAEGIAYQKEIDEALSGKMSAAEEEEVLAELEALQAEQMPKLPDAPIHSLPTKVEVPTTVGEEPEEEQPERRQAIAA